FLCICRPTPTSRPSPYTTLFRSPRIARQPEHPLGEDVEHHLRGATLDRVGPRSQEAVLGWAVLELRRSDQLVPTGEESAIETHQDRKSTRLNSSHVKISYAVSSV